MPDVLFRKVGGTVLKEIPFLTPLFKKGPLLCRQFYQKVDYLASVKAHYILLSFFLFKNGWTLIQESRFKYIISPMPHFGWMDFLPFSPPFHLLIYGSLLALSLWSIFQPRRVVFVAIFILYFFLEVFFLCLSLIPIPLVNLTFFESQDFS